MRCFSLLPDSFGAHIIKSWGHYDSIFFGQVYCPCLRELRVY